MDNDKKTVTIKSDIVKRDLYHLVMLFNIEVEENEFKNYLLSNLTSEEISKYNKNECVHLDVDDICEKCTWKYV